VAPFQPRDGSPFGAMNPFLQSTFDDIAHRLKLIGLQVH
jgi:hypothetical protein